MSVMYRMTNLLRRAVSAVLPYRPMAGGGDVLDGEYETGAWDYLRSIDELSRFSVVAGYCHFLAPGGAILEIGCGDGILHERLDETKYRRYIGVDVSAYAIDQASAAANERSDFVAADAATFEPGEPFDVIVFNECLEYFDDPLAVVQRYDRHLGPGGVHVVSMFVGQQTVRTHKIWRMLRTAYETKAATRVSNDKGFTWRIAVLRPAAAATPPRRNAPHRPA